MENKFKNLLSPLQIGKLTIKNRLAVAPMGDGYMGLAGPHGEYSDLGIEYVTQRARGGWGLFYLGCTAFPDNKVDPHSDIYNILDHQDAYIKQGKRMAELSHVYDMKVFQQITMGVGRNHPGNYSASQVPEFYDPDTLTKELTKEQIQLKKGCMIEMASRSRWQDRRCRIGQTIHGRPVLCQEA